MGELLDTPIKEMEGDEDNKDGKKFIGHNDVLKYGVRSIQ